MNKKTEDKYSEAWCAANSRVSGWAFSTPRPRSEPVVMYARFLSREEAIKLILWNYGLKSWEIAEEKGFVLIPPEAAPENTWAKKLSARSSIT